MISSARISSSPSVGQRGKALVAEAGALAGRGVPVLVEREVVDVGEA